jgi:hypothetical protein
MLGFRKSAALVGKRKRKQGSEVLIMVVFIIQDSGDKNFSSLLTITKNIVVVCNRDCPVFGDPTEHIKKIKHQLQYFNPAQDYLVMVGDPINIGLCIHEVMMKGKEVILAKYDRQTQCYIPVKIPNNLTNEKEK